jgi:hypothetical protein
VLKTSRVSREQKCLAFASGAGTAGTRSGCQASHFPKRPSLSRLSEPDVKVEMLGILVSAEIGGHSAGAVLSLNLRGDIANDFQQLVQKRYIVATEIGQRRDVNLWHHNYVKLPVRTGMVKS